MNFWHTKKKGEREGGVLSIFFHTPCAYRCVAPKNDPSSESFEPKGNTQYAHGDAGKIGYVPMCPCAAERFGLG